MDYSLIKKIVPELNTALAGAKVAKIYQPSPDILIFKLWNGRETLRLLVSAEGEKSRLHLTEQSWPNPHIPPRFCQLLRARISRINTLQVVNDDRIVQFDCNGKGGPCRLLVELTGHRSNMVLVAGDGVIIDVLKRINGGTGRRSLLAGEKYRFPEKRGQSDEKRIERDGEGGNGTPLSRSVEKLYSEEGRARNKLDFRQQLLATIKKNITKLRKRTTRIEDDIKRQGESDHYRHYGELLLASLHTVRRDDRVVTLSDYSTDPPVDVEIDLDPRLTPHENAEKYFKKYKKGKRGLEHSKRRLAEAQAELTWLEQLDYQLHDTVKNSDIEEIAEELRRAGLFRDQNNLHKKRTQQPSQPHEALSPSGFKVIWGRNNRQNDDISTRLLKAGDLWFHALGLPGAHVVLKIPAGQQPRQADIHYAAALAAGYSKAKNDLKVDVMQAAAKAVKKPRGGHPGLVSVLEYTTLLVEPRRHD